MYENPLSDSSDEYDQPPLLNTQELSFPKKDAYKPPSPKREVYKPPSPRRAKPRSSSSSSEEGVLDPSLLAPFKDNKPSKPEPARQDPYQKE